MQVLAINEHPVGLSRELFPFFFHFCREIARELQVNLLGYDYSGYGASTGLPTVLNTFSDIDACLAWLIQQGKQLEDIILYGQSVGSGPTCHLAARTPKLGGVVLHSPLATGDFL